MHRLWVEEPRLLNVSLCQLCLLSARNYYTIMKNEFMGLFLAILLSALCHRHITALAKHESQRPTFNTTMVGLAGINCSSVCL